MISSPLETTTISPEVVIIPDMVKDTTIINTTDTTDQVDAPELENHSLNLDWLRHAPDVVKEMWYNPDPREEKYVVPLKRVIIHPDKKKPAMQLIKEAGFHGETHTVTTQDGFELEMYRINVGGDEFKDSHQKPVLIQHGIFGDSDSWIMNGKHSLPYKLAMAGYDVWLGNNRGTKFGRKNLNLDIEADGEKFFDYSFYEMGKYDAPAQVDYIRNHLGVNTISYIGHSQGTT